GRAPRPAGRGAEPALLDLHGAVDLEGFGAVAEQTGEAQRSGKGREQSARRHEFPEHGPPSPAGPPQPWLTASTLPSSQATALGEEKRPRTPGKRVLASLCRFGKGKRGSCGGGPPPGGGGGGEGGMEQ